MNTILKSALAALIVAMTAGVAHAGSETVLTFKADPGSTGAGTGQTGKRVSTAKDDAASATVTVERFINVPGMSARASDVQVVISYVDATGAVQVIPTGVYEDGCKAEETDEGVDVVCEIVFAQ